MAKKLDFIQKFLFFFIKLKQIQKDYDINRSSKNQKVYAVQLSRYYQYW